MLPIKMTKVKYALWDRSMHVHNHRLRQYILDTHLALKRQIPELVINQNVDRLLQDQQLQDATHIAVICSGIIVLHPGPFKKGIERHCYDSSWMISGHILLEHKTYPHISPQVFIVNVELYNQLKKPAIGTAREVQDLLLPKPVPSCEHNNRMPRCCRCSWGPIDFVLSSLSTIHQWRCHWSRPQIAVSLSIAGPVISSIRCGDLRTPTRRQGSC